jgi:hypothetical protein
MITRAGELNRRAHRQPGRPRTRSPSARTPVLLWAPGNWLGKWKLLARWNQAEIKPRRKTDGSLDRRVTTTSRRSRGQGRMKRDNGEPWAGRSHSPAPAKNAQHRDGSPHDRIGSEESHGNPKSRAGKTHAGTPARPCIPPSQSSRILSKSQVCLYKSPKMPDGCWPH